MTQQQLEEKIEKLINKSLLSGTREVEDALKELAAYVREETLREVRDVLEESCGDLPANVRTVLSIYVLKSINGLCKD